MAAPVGKSTQNLVAGIFKSLRNVQGDRGYGRGGKWPGEPSNMNPGDNHTHECEADITGFKVEPNVEVAYTDPKTNQRAKVPGAAFQFTYATQEGDTVLKWAGERLMIPYDRSKIPGDPEGDWKKNPRRTMESRAERLTGLWQGIYGEDSDPADFNIEEELTTLIKQAEEQGATLRVRVRCTFRCTETTTQDKGGGSSKKKYVNKAEYIDELLVAPTEETPAEEVPDETPPDDAHEEAPDEAADEAEAPAEEPQEEAPAPAKKPAGTAGKKPAASRKQ